MLEIVLLRRDVDGEAVVLRKVLSKDKGEFQCSPEGLELRLKMEAGWAPVVVGLEWVTKRRSKIFNTTVDGDLVMREAMYLVPWVLYVPGPGMVRYRWIRWRRVPETSERR